MDMFPITQLE